MKPRGAESRFCWFRPAGGRVRLGTSGSCRSLSRRFRTIIYDGRGTGRSGKPKDGYTVKQFAADGIELLQQLGVTRCHFVGFAIGGQIVQAMAIERPDLVASLTIAATGPGSRRLDGTMREVGPEALTGDQEDRLRKIYPQTYR